MKLDGSLLDRMVEAGIPLTRALQYFRDNPEGSAGETLRLAVEDADPTGFYSTYRNNGGALDYLTNAALMFTPAKGGGRRAVRVDKHGKPDMNDLGMWYSDKSRQLDRVERKIADRDPSITVEYLENELNIQERNIDGWTEALNDPNISEIKRKAIEERLQSCINEAAEIRNRLNEATLNILDYKGMTLDDFHNKYGSGLYDDISEKYIDKKLADEYGQSNVDDYKQQAWEAYLNNH
jgi:hypothetical protein